MNKTAILCLALGSYIHIVTAQPSPRADDERAIRLVIQQRETAWNAGDVEAYGRLLTDDVDLLSRLAQGRRAILDLYVEQRGVPETPIR